jgi:hypothetical protein
MSLQHYALVTYLALIPSNKETYLRISTAASAKIHIAKFSTETLHSDLLDYLENAGDFHTKNANFVSYVALYVAYLPCGVSIEFLFLKPEKTVRVKRLDDIQVTDYVDYFIYEEAVSLSSQTFYHRNCSLWFHTPLLKAEDYKAIAQPGFVFFKIISNARGHYISNLNLSEHTCVAFKLKGE